MRSLSVLAAVTVCMFGTSCKASRTDGRPYAFAELVDKDEVEIHRTATDSTFFHSDCTLRYRGGNPSTAMAKGLFDNTFRQPMEVKPVDVRRLDETLAFYRTCPRCRYPTRKVRLDIVWYRDGIVARKETLVAETEGDALPSSAKDFDVLAMETGVPRDKMEVIDAYPPQLGTGHPVDAPKRE
jgi:hypothetical protein